MKLKKVKKHCSKVFGLRAEEQGFLVKIDFSTRLPFLLRWKTVDTIFVVLSFNIHVCRYLSTVALSLLRDGKQWKRSYQHA